MSVRGWVYLITNKAMPGLVKIGFSTKDPILRANELGVTGLPHPYKVEYDVLVKDPGDCEKRIHNFFINRREGKEWFRCSLGEIIEAIRLTIGDKVLLENARCDLEEVLGKEEKCNYPGCNAMGRKRVNNWCYCREHYPAMKKYYGKSAKSTDDTNFDRQSGRL